MPVRVLQQLLASGEYDETEDTVSVEGEFIEADNEYRPVRQVILGLTPNFLLIACRHITDETTGVNDATYLNGLDLSSAWPICLLRFTFSTTRRELSVWHTSEVRHYELTTTQLNGDLDETWKCWIERALYLDEDPYGHIRAFFDRYDVPYPENYVTWDQGPCSNTEHNTYNMPLLSPSDCELNDGSTDDFALNNGLLTDDTLLTRLSNDSLLNKLLDLDAVIELELLIAENEKKKAEEKKNQLENDKKATQSQKKESWNKRLCCK